MIYSFVVLSYNQERYIIENLESIKWQLLQYGGDKSVQLIIADDCSTDRTVDFAKRWINLNKSLFINTQIFINPKNGGVASNAANGFSAIIGDVFSYVGADDLYSQENIFQYLDLLCDFDVIDSAVFEFSMKNSSYEISNVSYKSFKKKIAKSFLPKKLLRIFSAATLFVGGSTFAFRKEYLTKQNIDYLKSFEMCEDRPLAQLIFATPNIRRLYYPEPMILQRNTHGSITRSSKDSVVQQKCFRDTIRIFEENMTDTNYLIRLCAKIGKWNLMDETKGSLIFNPYYLFIFLLCIIKRRQIKKIFKTNFLNKISDSMNHLDMIANKAKMFYLVLEGI